MDADFSGILAGTCNKIDALAVDSAIIGGNCNRIGSSVGHSIIIGGSGQYAGSSKQLLLAGCNGVFCQGINNFTLAGGASAVYIGMVGACNHRLGLPVSSIRYKENVKNIADETLDLLSKINPVEFRYKNDADKVRHFGLIAEELQTVIPEACRYNSSGEIEGVNYPYFWGLILAELQRLRKEQELDRKRIRALEEQLKESE